MNSSFFKYQLGSIILLAISFCALSYLVYRNITLNDATNTSYHAIRELDLMNQDFFRCEASVRGYLITKDFDVLNKSLLKYENSIEKHLINASKSLSKDSMHKQHIEKLRILVGLRLNLMKSSFYGDSSDTENWHKNLVISGDEVMDQLIPLVNTVKKHEQRKLKRLNSDLIATKSSLTIVLPLLLLFALVLYFSATRQSKVLNEKIKTERDKLKEEKQYYKFLFDKNPIKLFVLDGKLNVTDCNETFCKVFSISKTDLAGKHIDSTFLNPINVQLSTLLKQEGEITNLEIELNLPGKNEESKVFLIDIQPDESKDQYLGSIKDISKRKTWEKEIRIAEKLSLTGNIARSIAHEVRNPLTNINLALEELETEVAEENKDLLELISRNSNRISQLITNLLHSSKNRNLDKTNFRLSTLLNETKALIKDRLLLKNIKFKITNLALQNDYVQANFQDLQTAILNLIINAIEAIEHDHGNISLVLNFESNNVTLSVADNGKGMNQEELDQIFNPFYTSKKKGNGLGLTSVQNSLQSYGGKINVSSIKGEGTVFNITLPLAAKETILLKEQ